MQRLTHSRINSFKKCRRRHWYEYENCIRSERDGKALRMGSAYHNGLEVIGNQQPIDAACERVYGDYSEAIYLADDIVYERETVLRLLCGWLWRWEEQPLKHIAAEQWFNLPLRNPATGRTSRNFSLAGKIDGIVRIGDGRLAVLEYKTTSEDLASDSDYWPRLQVDQQISIYVLAARALGYDVDTVLYDVTRKPTIKPSAVPMLDGEGVKIVLDTAGDRVRTKDGRKWRQTGDAKAGYTLVTRDMTTDEWGEKLSEDIGTRPEWYYSRREIPRTTDQLAEVESELWDIAHTMRQAQLHGLHYRTTTADTCCFCPFFGPCTTGYDPTTDALPEGLVQLDDPHQELNDANETPAASPA